MSTFQIINYFKFFLTSFFAWVVINYIFNAYSIDSFWSFLCEFFLVGAWFLSGLRLFLTAGLTLSYITIRADNSANKSLFVKFSRFCIWDDVYNK